jgi:hypothetical protein
MYIVLALGAIAYFSSSSGGGSLSLLSCWPISPVSPIPIIAITAVVSNVRIFRALVMIATTVTNWEPSLPRPSHPPLSPFPLLLYLPFHNRFINAATNEFVFGFLLERGEDGSVGYGLARPVQAQLWRLPTREHVIRRADNLVGPYLCS